MAFKKKRVFKKKVAKKGRKPTLKRQSIKRMIKTEIARNIEDKDQMMINTDRSIYSSTNTNFPDNVITLGPSGDLQVVQGTTQGSRIGNKITTKSLIFRGTICPKTYNATSNPAPIPQVVKMVIFYDKTDPVTLPAVSTNFFQNGSADAGFQNDLVDMWRPFNTERYRILTTRTLKVGHAAGTGTGGVAGQQYYSNNDFKMAANFKINLTKYYPKRVVFNENSTTPTTRQLFCIFYCAAGSGEQNGALWIPLTAQYAQNYKFEDA